MTIASSVTPAKAADTGASPTPAPTAAPVTGPVATQAAPAALTVAQANSAPAPQPSPTQSTPLATSAVQVEVAGPARIERRHSTIVLTFIAVVVLPVALCVLYLSLLARDQFHSSVSFSVQAENGQSASNLLSGLTQLAGATSSASDQEILFQYLQSQDLVAELNQQIDLRAIFSRNWPADPIFAFDPNGSIEDLQSFWLRNVDISQDANGLMTVLVRAPTAEEALRLSQAVFDLASVLINRIAAATRDDSLRYSRAELAAAEERLTTARQEMTSFRLRTQIIDPTVDLQGQMSILNGLRAQLVEMMIELEKLGPGLGETDPRRIQLLNNKASIELAIEVESRKFGEGGLGPGGESFATLFSEYERLSANLQFAEGTYLAAVSGYDAVLSAAARQSRYLVAHIRPTLAERALYPKRAKLAAIFAGFAFLFWALGVLVYYSVRDRR